MDIYDPIALVLDLPPISHTKINRAVKKHKHSSVNFDTTGTKNGFYGRKHTEKTLQKMRKPKSSETRKRMSKPKTVEHRKNISAVTKGRVFYNNGTKDFLLVSGDPREKTLTKGRLNMNRWSKRKSLQVSPPSRCSSQSY